MSAIQYLNAFRLYGWDVLLLAGAVSLLTALLKKTVLKNAPNKLYVFVPFALGTVLYAVYRAIVTLSAEPFTTGLAATFEGGFACGCAATLYYVVYEQFFRKRMDGTDADNEQSADGEDQGGSAPDAGAESVSPVAPLLEGYVPEETREAVARTLCEGARKKTGNELREFVRETLFSAAPACSEAELMALTELVTAYLAALTQT